MFAKSFPSFNDFRNCFDFSAADPVTSFFRKRRLKKSLEFIIRRRFKKIKHISIRENETENDQKETVFKNDVQ